MLNEDTWPRKTNAYYLADSSFVLSLGEPGSKIARSIVTLLSTQDVNVFYTDTVFLAVISEMHRVIQDSIRANDN